MIYVSGATVSPSLNKLKPTRLARIGLLAMHSSAGITAKDCELSSKYLDIHKFLLIVSAFLL